MVMRKFPELRKFSWNSTFEEKWNTTVQKSASGRVRTLTNQLYPAWTIKASYPALTDAQADELLGFVALIKGSFEAFLWLDPEHNTEKGAPLAQVSSSKYQCVARIGSYVEPVEYVENVTVLVNGAIVPATNYTVSGGIITFQQIPSGTLTANYTYYWKVILADDGLTISKKFDNINTAEIKLEVVR